jgi:hypothetical protein
MNQEPDPQPDSSEQPGTTASVAEFPSEPFPCPACGQMLGASCRVCVACQHVIDPAELAAARMAARPPSTPLPIQPGESAATRVRFPWRIFFVVLFVSFLLTELFMELWGVEKAQLAMATVQALAGAWVMIDAQRLRLPRPFRWGLGSMLLPVIIFPWYLARRRWPQATCPAVEGPLIRVLLYLFFAILFVSALVYLGSHSPYLMHGPKPK